MQNLRPHRNNATSQFAVQYQTRLDENKLVVEVVADCPFYTLNKEFTAGSYENWGLWDFDVLELFVQRKDADNHYLELQTSPLSQYFALKIKRPREETEEFIPQNIKIEVLREGQSFRAKFILLLDEIPGTGHEIYGNICACLGTQNQREYFAANINTEEKPDFHRPELFISMGEIEKAKTR